MDPQATPVPVREWGYLIGGEFRNSGKPLEVRSPYDDSLVGITFYPKDRDLEDAIQGAGVGFQATAALPTYRRSEILRNISAGLETRREELIHVLALEAGRPRFLGLHNWLHNRVPT